MSIISNPSVITDLRSGESIILDVQASKFRPGVSLVFGTKELLTFALEDPEEITKLIQELKSAALECWPQLQLNNDDQIDPELDRALGGHSKYPTI